MRVDTNPNSIRINAHECFVDIRNVEDMPNSYSGTGLEIPIFSDYSCWAIVSENGRDKIMVFPERSWLDEYLENHKKARLMNIFNHHSK